MLPKSYALLQESRHRMLYAYAKVQYVDACLLATVDVISWMPVIGRRELLPLQLSMTSLGAAVSAAIVCRLWWCYVGSVMVCEDDFTQLQYFMKA